MAGIIFFNFFLKKVCGITQKKHIFALTKTNKKFFVKISGCGVIGSHARLRIWCREAWGFESLHPHYAKRLFRVIIRRLELLVRIFFFSLRTMPWWWNW